MTSNTAILEAARHYSNLGLIIHPLLSPDAPIINPRTNKPQSPGKGVLIKAWDDVEKPLTEKEIKKYWEYGRNPYFDKANIGLQCGKRSGVLVVDVDDWNPAIWNEFTTGLKTSEWLISRRTKRRGHIFFKYTEAMKAQKHHDLGIEILSDGSNAVLPPSRHKSGQTYEFNRELKTLEDIPEMPKELITRLKALFTDNDKLKVILRKCKPCLREKFEAHQKAPNVNDWHSSTGRQQTLALMADLKANGANFEVLDLACKYIFREQYSREISEHELGPEGNKIKKPWKCDTIQRELGSITLDKNLNSKCDNCAFRGQRKQEEEKKTVSSNDFLDNAVKEMTAAEIELLKTNFSQRRLICNLPKDHFITQFVAYADRMSDGYREYKILAGFWLLSSIVQRKPKIDLATSVDGIHLNIWTTFLGLSSISRKTTIIEIARHFLAYAIGKPVTDTDYSLEGYLESLSQEPIKFMVNDEVSTTYQKMGQKYNAGYFEFECKIYDGSSQNKRLASGGKREQKTFDIKDPYVTKLTASTFAKFKRSITIPDFDSGFGFRYVYAAPTYEFNQRPLRLTTDEDITARSDLEKRTALLVRFFRDMPPFTMDIEPEAMQFYIDTDIDVNKQLAKASNQEFLASVWSRYGIYILKFAALIEIGKSTVSSKITLESMKIAAAMILDYFLPTICDVYNLLTVDPTNNMIDRIIEALKASNGICAHSDLLRKTKLKSREFHELILTMQESGQIEVISEKSPGNNKTQFFYRLIDCDAVRLSLDRGQIRQIPQVPQIPRVSNEEIQEGIWENLKELKECTSTHLDVQTKQYNNSQILSNSPIENSVRYSGNLGNLDNLGNLPTNQSEISYYTDSSSNPTPLSNRYTQNPKRHLKSDLSELERTKVDLIDYKCESQKYAEWIHSSLMDQFITGYMEDRQITEGRDYLITLAHLCNNTKWKYPAGIFEESF